MNKLQIISDNIDFWNKQYIQDLAYFHAGMITKNRLDEVKANLEEWKSKLFSDQ
jgi:hypothetical protein